MIYSIISISVFTAYLVFILVKFPNLKSISDSYYHLKNKIWFTLALWGFAIPAMIAGDTLLMFFAGSGIAFVGAAAEFKQVMTKTVHYVAAVCGIVFGMLSLGFDFGLWWVVVLAAIGSLGIRLTFKNWIFWVEVFCFYVILISLLFKLSDDGTYIFTTVGAGAFG